MNIDNIKLLAEILSSHGLTKLEVTEGETKICLEKTAAVLSTVASPVISLPTQKETLTADNKVETIDFNNITEVKSPIVGVFYASPTPETDPFVSIGSKVRKGDVICIIEAMKLMNEITAECDGEIVDICIKNGDIAEFGQTLFKMF